MSGCSASVSCIPLYHSMTPTLPLTMGCNINNLIDVTIIYHYPQTDELSYKLVKTCFNRIFSISSKSFFFLSCFVIFALNYGPVSFDCSPIFFSLKKKGPPYGNVCIRLWYHISWCILVRYVLSAISIKMCQLLAARWLFSPDHNPFAPPRKLTVAHMIY